MVIYPNIGSDGNKIQHTERDLYVYNNNDDDDNNNIQNLYRALDNLQENCSKALHKQYKM